MKNINKDFLTGLIVTLITISVISGGVYMYTKSSFSVPSFFSSSVSVPDNFVTYNSPMGFSISHPEDWTTRDISGVDASFGGALIMSPGTSVKYSKYSRLDKSDTIEQLVNIGAGAALNPLSFSQLKTSIEAMLEHTYQPVTREFTSKKNIKINGFDAFEMMYTENNSTDKSAFKHAVVAMLLSDPSGGTSIKNSQNLGAWVILDYQARPDVFDQKLAEQIFASFKEHILRTGAGGH